MSNEYIQIQNQLSQKVIIPDTIAEGYAPQEKDVVFTLDVQYEQNDAFVAIDVLEWNHKPIGVFTFQTTVVENYVPGFFAFREAPVLQSAIEALKNKHNLSPDLLIIDGHGIAHPRKFGIASYVGVTNELPSIGIAKRSLLPYSGELQTSKGSTLPVLLDNETVGFVWRSQTGVKPVFVSAGHKISQQQSLQVIDALTETYRICEPIRRADQSARKFARNELDGSFEVL